MYYIIRLGINIKGNLLSIAIVYVQIEKLYSLKSKIQICIYIYVCIQSIYIDNYIICYEREALRNASVI